MTNRHDKRRGWLTAWESQKEDNQDAQQAIAERRSRE